MDEHAPSSGSFHKPPLDLINALLADHAMLSLWEAITPLARNEWICWIEDAKKGPTRHARIERTRASLKAGKRRPCCWPGCPHRGKAVRNPAVPADAK